jgi:oligo-1,6-glucosidase
LIALRHVDDVVVDGEFAMLLPDDPHVYAFTRRGCDRELLVLGNFSGEAQRVAVPSEWGGATLLLGNYVEPAPRGDAVPALRPWEARVYERRTR